MATDGNAYVNGEGGIRVRELFAAIALAGLVGKYTLKEPRDQEIVGAMAVELAESLISSLNTVGDGIRKSG